MSTLKCYRCGYETTDGSQFVRNQGDGKTYWAQFCCPQCCTIPAKVAPVPDRWTKAPWSDPDWSLEETNHGLYIRVNHKDGGSSSAPMVPSHQMAKQPASLLRDGLEGTMWDHHKRLIARGDDRSKAFHQLTEEWRGMNPDASPDDLREAMDVFRREHNVGPHDDRVVHDGPAVQKRSGYRAWC